MVIEPSYVLHWVNRFRTCFQVSLQQSLPWKLPNQHPIATWDESGNSSRRQYLHRQRIVANLKSLFDHSQGRNNHACIRKELGRSSQVIRHASLLFNSDYNACGLVHVAADQPHQERQSVGTQSRVSQLKRIQCSSQGMLHVLILGKTTGIT